MMILRLSCLPVIFLLLIPPATGHAQEKTKRKPNIVLIFADDLGYGELGCQGNHQIPTPHIDSIAKNGIRFTNGYVSAPYCCPSRAGLMTGRYQTRFGHELNAVGDQNIQPHIGLPASEITIAQLLKNAGYATGLIGKWHLGGAEKYHPQRRGFDEFYGFLHEGHFYVPPPYKGVTSRLRPNEPPYDKNNSILRGTKPIIEKEYFTEAITREAVKFLDKHQKKPFFLYLAYSAVHSPMQAPHKYMKRFNHLGDEHRQIFAAMLAAMDDSIGMVLGKLRELDLEEDTLVIFLSDNGGPIAELTSMNWPLRGGKGQLWEGGVRIPFMMQWKGHLPAGRVYHEPVISLDLLPTALAVAGGDLPKNRVIDGVNLLPFLRGQMKQPPHETLYWRYGPNFALRKGKWKLVKQRDRGGKKPSLQLFDLSKDIDETNDLAAKEPALVTGLLSEWNTINREMVEPRWSRGAPKKKKVTVPRNAVCGLSQNAKAPGQRSGGQSNKPAPRELKRIRYNNSGLTVDLGIGLWAWPLPMDWDNDGDIDLVVACPDKPNHGVFLFENPGGEDKMPIFKAPVRIGPHLSNVQPSYIDGKVRLLIPGNELIDFKKNQFRKRKKIRPTTNIHNNRVRANQWRYVDYDGDGNLDVIVGVGDWTAYGWDNAYDQTGRWTRGPLHGYVYLLRNQGTNIKAKYAQPAKLKAGGKIIDVYGMPTPNFADFDGDGDLDLLCGEFINQFTYFENTGTRTKPQYAAGKKLTANGQPIAMDLQMIVPVAIDWDKDGDIDLICGDEDGRVAFIEHTGKILDGMPQFAQPRYFKQQAHEVRFGALIAPFSFDWDNDGDEDLICGNTAGYIGLIENLGGNPPKWAAPLKLKAGGKTIRIQAGPNGSIQGPCEANWGYTVPCVADWDQDGLPDVLTNSIWGKVVWYRNIGTRKQPKLAAAQPIEVEWQGNAPKPQWNWWNPKGKELVTQWRTQRNVIDLDKDGLNDLVMLDHEGYLAFFERSKQNGHLRLQPCRRVFRATGPSVFDSRHQVKGKNASLLQLNNGNAGRSGRRKICITDWDGDGKPDLLVNSVNANWLRNVSKKKGQFLFRDMGMMSELILAGHTTSPTVVDWDRNGVPDMLLGAEDGYLYYLQNPRGK